MAIQDESLTVAITADTTQANAALADMEARLAALEAAYTKGSTAGGMFTLTTGEVASVSGNAARALNALDIEAGGAAARVTALAGAMDGLKSAALPMAGVLGGMIVGFQGFEALKSGIAAANDLQHSLETMRATIEGQGGAWDSLSGSIKNFIDTESLAAGMARNDVASALNAAAAAMGSVADAERVVAVAEEVAIGQHKSLSEVTDALIHAEAGRAIGLAADDVELKKLIQSHAHLGAILNELHDRYGKQLQMTDDNTLAWNREHVAMGKVGEEIGAGLLPLMTRLADGMMAIPDLAHEIGKAFGEGFGAAILAAQALGSALAGVGAAMADLLSGKFGNIASDFSAHLGAARNQGMGALHLGLSGMADLFGAPGNAADETAKRLADALKAHDAMAGPFDPNWGPQIGNTRGGHAGAGGGKAAGAGTDSRYGGMSAAEAYKQVQAEIANSIEWLQRERDANHITTEQWIDGLKRIEGEYVLSGQQRTRIENEISSLQKKLGSEHQAAMSKELSDIMKDDQWKVDHHHMTYQQMISDLQAYASAHKDMSQHLKDEFTDDLAITKQRQADELAKEVEASKVAYQTMHDQAQKYADETISFFENIGKSGKSVFQDLLSGFEHMIENMLAKMAESKLADIFMGFLGAGAGVASVGSQMGPFGLLDIAPVQTPAGAALPVHIAGVQQGVLGGLVSGGGGGLTLMGGLSLLGGAAGIGSMLGGLEGGGSHSTWGALGSIAGVAGVGILGSILGGGSVMGSLGATLAMGPAGWLTLGGAALLGGLAGGLFGHKDDPAKMPDKYMPGYQDWLSAFNGGPGDNLSKIEGFLKTVNPSSLSGQALADFQQLQALGGSSGDIGVAHEKDGIFTLGSGATDSVTDYINLTTRALQELGSAANTTAASIFTVTRLYPDFNAANISGGVPGSGGSTGASGGNPITTLPGPQQPITINIDARGSLGINTDDIILKISQGLNKLNNGMGFGGYRSAVSRAGGGG